MSESKHTPRPWTMIEDSWGNPDIDPGGFQIDAPGITQLAYVWRASKRLGSNEQFGAQHAKANARLIAAAPDLLAALTNCLPFVKQFVDDGAAVAISEATTAIAKATAP